jgi:hypothetical protein
MMFTNIQAVTLSLSAMIGAAAASAQSYRFQESFDAVKHIKICFLMPGNVQSISR